MKTYLVGCKYKGTSEISYAAARALAVYCVAEFMSYDNAARCKFTLDASNNNPNRIYFIEESEEVDLIDEDEEFEERYGW